MQREADKYRVRFTTFTHIKTAQRQQKRKRGRTYRSDMLLRFPRLSGMVPVSWLLPSHLQQWEHEDKTMRI